jgi:hypothetical protein
LFQRLGDVVHEDKLCRASLGKLKESAAECDSNSITLKRKYANTKKNNCKKINVNNVRFIAQFARGRTKVFCCAKGEKKRDVAKQKKIDFFFFLTFFIGRFFDFFRFQHAATISEKLDKLALIDVDS